MSLIKDIRSCTYCVNNLPLEPKPVVSFSSKSRIIIVGQAPGLKVHKTGIPWNDASGKRLREWLGVTKEQFYDTNIFGIVPMGFCYPGRGKSGDNPPRPECAEIWMEKVLKFLRNKELIILIGQYSQDYFLAERKKATLTETVRSWKEYSPDYFVLPHPSPRNNIWLKKNPWFQDSTLKALRTRIKKLI